MCELQNIYLLARQRKMAESYKGGISFMFHNDLSSLPYFSCRSFLCELNLFNPKTHIECFSFLWYVWYVCFSLLFPITHYFAFVFALGTWSFLGIVLSVITRILMMIVFPLFHLSEQINKQNSPKEKEMRHIYKMGSHHLAFEQRSEGKKDASLATCEKV